MVRLEIVDFGDSGTYDNGTMSKFIGGDGYRGQAITEEQIDKAGYIAYTDKAENQSFDGDGVHDGAFWTGYSGDGGPCDGSTRNTGSNWTNYFTIDLSSLAGKYVEIKVKFATESGYDDGIIAVQDTLGTPEEGEATSAEAQEATLWSGEVTEDTVLYLVFSTSVGIYSIEILTA